MAPRPLAQPLADRGLGRVTERQVVELALQVLLELAGGLDTRRDGSGSRQCRTIEATAGETAGFADPDVGPGVPTVGDHRRQDRIDRARDGSGTGASPVSSSWRITPERIDVAPGVDRLLAVAEGLEVLGGHVGQRPADQRDGGPRRLSVSAARLKSRRIGSPSSAKRMLAGFRSRWRMPRSWAWARPSATRAISQSTAGT